MKLIYIGYAVSKDLESSSKAVSVAGNNMENELIKNFTEIQKQNFYSISIVPLPSYPRSSRVIYRKKDLNLENDAISHSIGYINIPLIKQLTIMFSLLFSLITKIISIKRKNKKEKIVVMTYNSASFLAIPVFLVSMLFRITKVCLVVDIPITFQNKKSLYFKIAKNVDNYVSLRLFKKYDAMVTLVEQTVKDFAPGVPYKLINYSVKKLVRNSTKSIYNDTGKILITFTGALEPYYGIKEMVEAVKELPFEYRLNLYGRGSLENYIREEMDHNLKIHFHGLVSNEEAVLAQCNSAILLLIRTNQELNKYGLPSKIIEYLASGTPIISTPISSIPSDLNQFINYIDDFTPETIANMIKIITKNEDAYRKFLIKAQLGKQYVLDHYTWEKQANEICDYLAEIIN